MPPEAAVFFLGALFLFVLAQTPGGARGRFGAVAGIAGGGV